MRLALASMNIRWEDKAANLELCRALLSQAKSTGAELVIFPEMTLTSFSVNVDLIAEAEDDSASLRAMARLAGEIGIGIIFGMALKNADGCQNQAIFLDEQGRCLARYAKIHPYSMGRENVFYRAGTQLRGAEFHNVSWGMTLCYDLRFPELYSALARQYEVLVNIANWPEARIAHWNTLLRARAIENQVFVVGVNRSGSDGRGVYPRSSMIFDAFGTQLQPLESRGELDVYELSTQSIRTLRESFNSVADRRPDLYRDWYC